MVKKIRPNLARARRIAAAIAEESAKSPAAVVQPPLSPAAAVDADTKKSKSSKSKK